MRFRPALLAAALTVGSLVGFTGTAYAAACTPGANSYPPSSCAAGVSSTSIPAGGSLTVSGEGFADAAMVHVYLHSSPVLLGSGTANANGAFELGVTIPLGAPLGQHEIVESGTNPDGSVRQLTAAITVTARAASTTAAATSSTGGGLPFTGAQIAGMSATGALLVFGGIGMLLVARRRRTAGWTSLGS